MEVCRCEKIPWRILRLLSTRFGITQWVISQECPLLPSPFSIHHYRVAKHNHDSYTYGFPLSSLQRALLKRLKAPLWFLPRVAHYAQGSLMYTTDLNRYYGWSVKLGCLSMEW